MLVIKLEDSLIYCLDIYPKQGKLRINDTSKTRKNEVFKYALEDKENGNLIELSPNEETGLDFDKFNLSSINVKHF
ncbi:MAG: hypothetical protein JJU02_10965 [Cryomorphaceae bacterium]|nr:hypothetical protein [Cryomorphaceae bacterium]